MQPAPSRKIDVVAALKGSPYVEVAVSLAEEFVKVRITEVNQVVNAPIRLKTTLGVDIYEVMELIVAHEKPSKIKKSS